MQVGRRASMGAPGKSRFDLHPTHDMTQTTSQKYAGRAGRGSLRRPYRDCRYTSARVQMLQRCSDASIYYSVRQVQHHVVPLLLSTRLRLGSWKRAPRSCGYRPSHMWLVSLTAPHADVVPMCICKTYHADSAGSALLERELGVRFRFAQGIAMRHQSHELWDCDPDVLVLSRSGCLLVLPWHELDICHQSCKPRMAMHGAKDRPRAAAGWCC